MQPHSRIHLIAPWKQGCTLCRCHLCPTYNCMTPTSPNQKGERQCCHSFRLLSGTCSLRFSHSTLCPCACNFKTFIHWCFQVPHTWQWAAFAQAFARAAVASLVKPHHVGVHSYMLPGTWQWAVFPHVLVQAVVSSLVKQHQPHVHAFLSRCHSDGKGLCVHKCLFRLL